MRSSDDVEDLKEKHLCYSCVNEKFLSAEIKQRGKRMRCSYCGRQRKSSTIEDMADTIEAAFHAHYRRTPNQPSDAEYSWLKESDEWWYREGEPVIDAIENAAEIPPEAAKDIQAVLADRFDDFEAAKMGEETEFSEESHYEEKGSDDREWRQEWDMFEKSLKTEGRFFNSLGAEHLDSVFGGIDKLTTYDGKPLVIEAGPRTSMESIYRARVFQSEPKLLAALCRPDLHLGSPPALLATAGRMNAQGISVFYGSNEPRVAIAEVRPPVGSRVAVARFSIIRLLRLLDLSALGEAMVQGSIFDASYAGRLERATFLRSLGRRITRPVMPDDEAFEYLATQAVADFLATQNEPQLDGIVFPSVQAGEAPAENSPLRGGTFSKKKAGGKTLNVVLFHKAARVEVLSIPDGTDIRASPGHNTEDGWEEEYSVIEETPPRKRRSNKRGAGSGSSSLGLLTVDALPAEAYDDREPSLRIDTQSVEVHGVRGVEFSTTDYSVFRHRWKRQRTKF